MKQKFKGIELTFVSIFIILMTFVMFGVVVSAQGSDGNNSDSSNQDNHPFYTIMEVVKSPRCMNCHPTDDMPRQTDAQYEHLFGVIRGDSNHGGPVLQCESCHHTENNAYSNVPGAPHWGLAPKTMGWLGLSDAEIARTLVDTSKNGGRDAEALVHHLTNDALVLWAWEPGEGREPPPVPLDEFRAALNAWLERGADLPEEYQLVESDEILEMTTAEGANNGN